MSTNNYNILIGTQKREVKKVSAKMGRPISNNPKKNDIKVRVDDKTHERLLKYCEDNKISKAEAIRKAINELLDK